MIGDIVVWGILLAIPVALIGSFTGGNGESDVGRTVDATVRGDTAYSRSLVLPILLVALGLPFLTVPALAIRTRLRARLS